MRINFLPKVFFLLIVYISSIFVFAKEENKRLSHSAFEALNIPLLKSIKKREILVAVIDDGFALHHKSLKNFIFTNKKEIPFNGIDDDKNGYIDDFQGWDVADMDSDVSVTSKLENSYIHGTFISSLITQIAEKCYGDDASNRIKILPIKVLSDNAQTTAIYDGYSGIKYATEIGVDIICCAWSGGITLKKEEREILNKAMQKDILIIGAAGNMYSEKSDLPASISGVLSIAALDTSFKKLNSSNYGMSIDFALPGQNVRGAHPSKENAWFMGDKTSAAAGLASGLAAILYSECPNSNSFEIVEALKSTAKPINDVNYRYNGKLGAGLPNLSKALDYLSNPNIRYTYFDEKRTEGSLYLSPKNKLYSRTIAPAGYYHSINIVPNTLNKEDFEQPIEVSNIDSVLFSGNIEEIIQGIKIDGNIATIKTIGNSKRDLAFNYFVETIDSTSLYCNGIVEITKESGTINDGSGDENYANNSSCSWHITATNRKRISLSFSKFDTEANVDFVWIFDGTKALPENVIAKFSGEKIPPEVISRSNKIKVWFITNENNSKKGWVLNFNGVD